MRDRIKNIGAFTLFVGVAVGFTSLPVHAAVATSGQTPAEAEAARQAKAKQQAEEARRQAEAREAAERARVQAARAKENAAEAKTVEAKNARAQAAEVHERALETPPQDRLQKEREEKARAEKEQAEKERIAKERADHEQAEKARLESDRKRIAAEKTAPPPKVKLTPEEVQKEREIAKKAAHFEQMYRARLARTNRLIRVYKAKGDQAKVAHLEELKTKLEKRNTNAKEGFRKQISAEHWEQLNAEMNHQHAKTEKDVHRLEKAEAAKKPGSH